MGITVHRLASHTKHPTQHTQNEGFCRCCCHFGCLCQLPGPGQPILGRPRQPRPCPPRPCLRWRPSRHRCCPRHRRCCPSCPIVPAIPLSGLVHQLCSRIQQHQL